MLDPWHWARLRMKVTERPECIKSSNPIFRSFHSLRCKYGQPTTAHQATANVILLLAYAALYSCLAVLWYHHKRRAGLVTRETRALSHYFCFESLLFGVQLLSSLLPMLPFFRQHGLMKLLTLCLVS